MYWRYSENEYNLFLTEILQEQTSARAIGVRYDQKTYAKIQLVRLRYSSSLDPRSDTVALHILAPAWCSHA